MARRVAKSGDQMKRGVWVAPWMGPNGEIILVAVSSKKRFVGKEVIPLGANHVEAAERLLDLLDEHDPDMRAILRAI